MEAIVQVEIQALQAKCVDIEQDLRAPDLSKEERVAINNRLAAIEGQITAWLSHLSAFAAAATPAAAAAPPVVAVPATLEFRPPPPLHFVTVRVEGVRRRGVKPTIWSVATGLRVGGYVERLSSTSVRFVACSSDLSRLQQFLDELVVTFPRARLSILTQGVTSTEQALLDCAGKFLKVSNTSLKRSTASDASQSRELTPEDGASDIVDRVSLSSLVGWNVRAR
jgi:acylphosphatase